jgi:hypothetical protein
VTIIGESPSIAGLVLTELNIEAKEKRNPVYIALTDAKKAFDKVFNNFVNMMIVEFPPYLRCSIVILDSSCAFPFLKVEMHSLSSSSVTSCIGCKIHQEIEGFVRIEIIETSPI